MSDDSLVTDAAVIAWKNMHCLIENGASDVEIDQAFKQYLEACAEQMALKERAKVGG